MKKVNNGEEGGGRRERWTRVRGLFFSVWNLEKVVRGKETLCTLLLSLPTLWSFPFFSSFTLRGMNSFLSRRPIVYFFQFPFIMICRNKNKGKKNVWSR